MYANNDQQFKIGVFALIVHRGSVLLCHRRDVDLWNLPGGALEPGEPPWEGVAREVYEETTLRVEVRRLIGVYSRPDQHEVAFGFACDIIAGNAQCTDEADAIRYYDIAQLPPNTNHEQVEALHRFDSDCMEVVLCVQAGPSPLQLLGVRG